MSREAAGPTTIALLGTGDIGRLHATAITTTPGLELAVTSGRDPTAAAELAASHGARLLPSEADMLGDDSIAAVDICVPNHLHEQYVVRALEAGKHVLCEKPIALTLDAAERMRAAATAADRILMIGTTLRYWPCYRAAHERLAGVREQVRSFSARRMLSLLRAVQGAQGWRHDSHRSGGAALDLQVHDIDFALWTFGHPTSVVSRGVRSRGGAWDHLWTLLSYPDLVVSIEASFLLQGDPVTMDFRALTEDASLAFSYQPAEFAMHGIASDEPSAAPTTSMLCEYRWGQPAAVLARDPADPVAAALADELAAFGAAVRTGDTNGIPTADEAIATLRVALASVESCETGEAIQVAA